MLQRIRVAYFGYSVEFTTSENKPDAIRAEANRIVTAKYGDPAERHLNYVEPGLPFPAYVPVQYWDTECGKFYPF